MKKVLSIIFFVVILTVLIFFIVFRKSESNDFSISNTTNKENQTIQNDDYIQADYSELIEKVFKNETLFVIVSLRLPIEFQPEGNLANDFDVKIQHKMIQTVQDNLQQEMQDYSFRVYTTYESIPYLAAEVDSATLEALIASPLVTAIQEDKPVPVN